MERMLPIAVVSLVALACTVARAAEQPLHVQCVYHAGHGLRALAADFRRSTGTRVEFHLHCREHFTPSAGSLKGRDLYISTSPENLAKAASLGLLAGDALPIGRVVPIIAVMKGNPRGFRTLSDLAREGVTVSYPVTCIGNVALRLVAKNKLEATVKPRMTIRTGNRTGVLVPLAEGKAQAAITWSCAVVESGRRDIDVVAIPAEQNVIDAVQAVVLKSAAAPEPARAFVAFLRSEPAIAKLRRYALHD